MATVTHDIVMSCQLSVRFWDQMVRARAATLTCRFSRLQFHQSDFITNVRLIILIIFSLFYPPGPRVGPG